PDLDAGQRIHRPVAAPQPDIPGDDQPGRPHGGVRHFHLRWRSDMHHDDAAAISGGCREREGNDLRAEERPHKESGKRKTENGKRKKENGKRKTENGKRKTENGKRKTASVRCRIFRRTVVERWRGCDETEKRVQ